MPDKPDKTTKPGTRPRRLGRGLAALVDQASTAVRESQAAVSAPLSASGTRPSTLVATPGGSPAAEIAGGSGTPDDIFVRILIGSVAPSPFQPREAVDEAALETLADSVRRSGVIQPVVVRRAGDGYELIAGERRWRAAKLAGLDRIPAIVRDVDDRTAAEWALVENVQRADLNPVERARAFRRLADEFGLTHAEIAKSAGIKRPTVANTIRLLDLDETLLAMLAAGSLTSGHAKVLLSVDDTHRRGELGARCAEQGWSVRHLEGEIATPTPPVPAGGAAPTANIAQTPRSHALRDLEQRLGDHLGTRISIRTNADGSKGKVAIDFYSLDHFDDLIARLGFRLGAD